MIKFIKYEEKPITLIGICAGVCYGSDIEDDEKNFKRGLQCIKDGHGRTLEYPDLIMIIDKYSIKVIRELYTHIIGVTRLQESTRYVNMKNSEVIVPSSIMKNEDALKIYNETIEHIFNSYEALMNMGIKKEDASGLLPLNLETKIVYKINLRALLALSEVRMCTRAYWEMRALLKELQNSIRALGGEWEIIADLMKPKCEKYGYCTEKFTCGRKPLKEGGEYESN